MQSRETAPRRHPASAQRFGRGPPPPPPFDPSLAAAAAHYPPARPRVRRGRTLSMQVTYSKRSRRTRAGWLRPPPPPPPTLYAELLPAAGHRRPTSIMTPATPATRPMAVRCCRPLSYRGNAAGHVTRARACVKGWTATGRVGGKGRWQWRTKGGKGPRN